MGILAIDGPAGAGKSSVAKALARRLGYRYINTGAIYRTIALFAIRNHLDNENQIAQAAIELDMSFEGDNVRLSGEDVSDAIREADVALRASEVSVLPKVRSSLLELQRRLAFEAEEGAVLEGRDIGTVVFPDAETKIFLTASAETRALRRTQQVEDKGGIASYEQILSEIRERDERDSARAVAPLRPAEDAVVVDSDGKTFEEVVAEIAEIASRGLLNE
ncbi:MAG: (d)CMP kinase [Myxococcota bacterium]|nr:(d)CMP kinase [Myxococcota bacterium]